jgi:hypothetical protein
VADATGLIAEENESNSGLTAAAQVAVVLFLTDLVVTTVQPPGNTLSDKLVSAPLQVRKPGLVPSGPVRGWYGRTRAARRRSPRGRWRRRGGAGRRR